MKLIFAGTPAFASGILQAVLQSRHRVVAVLTQPDRPAGRGLATGVSEVKRLALTHHLPVLQPASLRDPAAQSAIADIGPDVMVVAAYGLLLPRRVLDLPRRGCVNVHASLLPRWRGAAPIQRAILAGDTRTGISIMQMDAGLDTGPVLMQEPCAIAEDDTAGTLHDRLAELGARLCVEALNALETGTLAASPQREEDATLAPKIRREETRIDWRASATAVQRQVRAFSPTPGAGARLRDTELKLWSCSIARGGGAPGEVLESSRDGVVVACGEGAVKLTELQRAGGRRLAAGDFLRGFPISRGERFARDSL